jgi:holin-like protein
MINTLLLLLVYELVGEALVRMTGLPLPGPVLGMFALLGTLVLRGRTWPELDAAATTLLSHLSLLFIPAGVGVIVHAQRLGAEWLSLLVSLLVSTVLTLGVTAWVLQFLLRRGHWAQATLASSPLASAPPRHPAFDLGPGAAPAPGEDQP